mgnify:CR=1 FL=1
MQIIKGLPYTKTERTPYRKSGPGGPDGGPPPPPPGMENAKPTRAALEIRKGAIAARDPALTGIVSNVKGENLRILKDSDELGGVFVSGEGSDFTLEHANIRLSGDTSGFDTKLCGAAVDDHAALTIRNSRIQMDGRQRLATAASNSSVLKVYDSTLISHGALWPADEPEVNYVMNGNMSIDLHTTPCTYYERVYYSGDRQIAMGTTSRNHHTNVWDGLFAISKETKNKIIALREGLRNGTIKDKQTYKRSNIPGINGSCTCDTNYRREAYIIDYNGLMFLDIDSVEDLDTVKNKVNALPYTVLSAESVSGGGLFAVFCVDNVTDGNDYRRAYCAAIKYLYEQGLSGNCEVDEKTIDPVRFRYQTIDPKPHYNPNAQLWTERADTAPSKREPKKNVVKKEPMEPREPDFSDEMLGEYWAAERIVDFKNKHIDLVRDVAYQTAFVAVDGKDYVIRDGINCQMPRDYIRDKGHIVGHRRWRNGLNEKFAIACAVVKYRHPDITADEFLLTMLQEFLTYYEVPSIDRRQTLSIIASGWRSSMTPHSMRKRNYKVNAEVARAKGLTNRQMQPTSTKHYRWDYMYNPAEYYDDTKTITENVKAMADQGHPIDRRTLKSALAEQGIMTYEQFNDYKAMLLYPEEVTDGYIAQECNLSRPTVCKRRHEWWQKIEAQQDTDEEAEEQLRMIGYDEAYERELDELFLQM